MQYSCCKIDHSSSLLQNSCRLNDRRMSMKQFRMSMKQSRCFMIDRSMSLKQLRMSMKQSRSLLIYRRMSLKQLRTTLRQSRCFMIERRTPLNGMKTKILQRNEGFLKGKWAMRCGSLKEPDRFEPLILLCQTMFVINPDLMDKKAFLILF